MPSTITVAQITDSHLRSDPGAGDYSADEMLSRAVALVADASPDVLLLTGDIADDGSTEAYERVAQAVSVLGVPVLATAGNHDIPSDVTVRQCVPSLDGCGPTTTFTPPISTSTHPWMRLEGGSELVTALTARGDVRVVVSGHLHEAFNVVLGGVSYIGCSSSFYSIKHRNNEFILDHGHVGALVLSLASDGEFTWRRLPDPIETGTLLGPFE